MKGIKLETDETIEPTYLYRQNEVIEAIAHALYYTANPDTDMCIPNCAFANAEKMFVEWRDGTRFNANKYTWATPRLCNGCEYASQIPCITDRLYYPCNECTRGKSQYKRRGDEV